MSNQLQQIVTPFGINVFGSALMRVAPDVVVFNFSASSISPDPKVAFKNARESAQKLQAFFAAAQLLDSGSSQISLDREFDYRTSPAQFIGYKAQVDFRVVVNEVHRMEEIAVGLVETGAEAIHTSYQTTRLKELRASARRQAVDAAREKALLYCEAAGVQLGELLHIEDVNPETLPRNSGHVPSEVLLDNYDHTQTFSPSNISVAAAVLLSYKIIG